MTNEIINESIIRTYMSKKGKTYTDLTNELNVANKTIHRYEDDANRQILQSNSHPSRDYYLTKIYNNHRLNDYFKALFLNETNFKNFVKNQVPTTLDDVTMDQLHESDKTTMFIDVLDLDIKSYNALIKRSSFRRISDLLSQSPTELRNEPYVFNKNHTEILMKLTYWCNEQNINPLDYPLFQTTLEQHTAKTTVYKEELFAKRTARNSTKRQIKALQKSRNTLLQSLNTNNVIKANDRERILNKQSEYNTLEKNLFAQLIDQTNDLNRYMYKLKY